MPNREGFGSLNSPDLETPMPPALIHGLPLPVVAALPPLPHSVPPLWQRLKQNPHLRAAIPYLPWRVAAFLTHLIVALLLRPFQRSRRVLHVMSMCHVAFLLTRALREQGVDADYAAVNQVWIKYEEGAWDHHVLHPPLARHTFHSFRPSLLAHAFRFWRLLAGYGAVHCHALATLTGSRDELRMIRLAGRGLVAHFRGDDVRRKAPTLAAAPGLNCCQECDYPKEVCDNLPDALRDEAFRHAHRHLVTTPDLLDSVPARLRPRFEHFPFLAPPVAKIVGPPRQRGYRDKTTWRIHHSTNHEGIDGTRFIRDAVRRLAAEGRCVELVEARQIPFQENLRLLDTCDLAVGKLRMGYYANAQVEALALGIPVLCYVRPEFLAALPDCPIIVTRPDTVYERILWCLDHPEELEALAARGPTFVRAHHDPGTLARRLGALYAAISARDGRR